MALRFWRRTALAVLVLTAVSASARAEPVALTFDDLPLLSPHPKPEEARRVARDLTRELRACHAPATAFVIGGIFADRPRLQRDLLTHWRRAGVTLGNHTWRHDSLNAMTAEAYIAGVARTDRLLHRLDPSGRRPPAVRWFRHPFLETGDTADKRATVETWLAEHHYRIAPVTLENDDDLFAAPYADAIARRDKPAAAHIRDEYVAFTAARIAWYRDAAQQLLGRRPALVSLMHASRLNADVLPELCRLLPANDLQPVTLEEALKDPAYALGEGPPDKDGDDWLNRWATILGKDLPWDSFPEAPADIKAAAAKLDPDSH